MSLKWISYYPVSRNMSVSDLRERLSPDLITQLIDETPVFRQLVSVEAKNTSAIEKLDTLLKVNNHKRTKYIKQLSVEISQSELDEYPYYFIHPKRLDHGDDIEFELSMPECSQCPWGAEILQPIRITDRLDPGIDFSEIQRSLRLGIEFVVSQRLRNIFESNNITGLQFDSIEESGDLYLARIVNEAFYIGERIVHGSLCKRHLVTIAPSMVGQRTPVESLVSDFVAIRGVLIGKSRYFTHPPEWVVSRRCLDILLAEVADLQRITMRIDERFLPCL